MAAKNNSRAGLPALIRNVAQTAQNSPNVTDAQLADAGLPLHKTSTRTFGKTMPPEL